MMLVLAISTLVVALVLFLLIGFANGMSDAPSAPGEPYTIPWVLLAISAALWVCWWFGWHPSW